MARYKHYLEIDVVEAARERVRYILDTFDTVAVMFSGGKDSLVCLNLVRQEVERRGGPPVNVVFLDQELLPRSVYEFLEWHRAQSWVRMFWFYVPMVSTKFVMGGTESIVTLDPSREPCWPKPEDVIEREPGDDRIFRQQVMDAYVYERCGFKGRTCFINGIRTDESLTRYRSCVNKLDDNYINASTCAAVKLGKPVYDWSEGDVMKWLHESGIPWCGAYDRQHLSGVPLRVATPLHAEHARELPKLPRCDPELYARVIELFPDAAVQARYGDDLDRAGLRAEYEDPHGLDGCFRYIDERIPNPAKRAAALAFMAKHETLHRNDPEAYSSALLLAHLVRGVTQRIVIPDRKG